MDNNQLIAEFLAKGGKVTNLPTGKRSRSESEMRIIASGNDKEVEELFARKAEQDDPTENPLSERQEMQYQAAVQYVVEISDLQNMGREATRFYIEGRYNRR